jgi:tetratricopeptide (TPR) repeat protein
MFLSRSFLIKLMSLLMVALALTAYIWPASTHSTPALAHGLHDHGPAISQAAGAGSIKGIALVQTDDKIESAMSAAPAAIAQEATIVDYPTEPGGELVELRPGTNGWTCFPDWADSPGNDPQCFDQVWMAWFNAYLAGSEPNITAPGVAYMLQGGSDASNTDPLAVAPAAGEDWVSTPPHVMLLFPGQLDTTLFSTDHQSGEPYIMWAGTPYEHIMMPVQAEATATAAHGHDASTPEEVSPLLGSLGHHHHPITTSSDLAQRYFDEGLILTFGFNHEEAIRSFNDALKLDPDCAMCYWGIAYALGPNINAPMDDAAVPEAYAALQKAIELAPQASEAEQAYIQALAERYAAEPVADRAPLDLAYAEAMRELANQYPDDLDAATLLAEALMDLSPWNYWTKEGEPTEYTNEIVSTLESVLERDPNHPAANHFYIHAVEASQTPERAIPSAERLEYLVPNAGHLVHMPGHIYWRVGRYHDVVRINQRAAYVDENHIHLVDSAPDPASQTFYSMAYYPHNYHFLFAGAQMEGRSEDALDAARRLVAAVPAEAYREVPPLEDFKPMPLFALARFGKWQEILDEPQPEANFQYTTGIWHWARGLAYLRLGQLDQAQAEYKQLSEIAQAQAMKDLVLWSFSPASTMLEIASHVLAGELAGAEGKPDEMIAELEAAVAIQDDLSYIEPPAWFYPVRQNLGAALLEAGRAAEAEAVYRADLEQYPNNGWSLFGLAQSLEAQGKSEEAAEVQHQFEMAWQYADMTLTASRF